MAEATTLWYARGAKHLAQGDFDWVNDSVKLMLATSGYVPDQTLDEYRSDVTNELAATGNYVAGGFALTLKSKSYDTGTNEERLAADTLAIVALTQSSAFIWGILYKARGGLASADELLGYIDFVEDQTPDGGDFIITWPSSGVLSLVVEE